MRIHVVICLVVLASTARAQSTAKSHRFPAASDTDTWQQLRGENPALPAWARTLVQPLPKTTGAMLHLDHLHRAKNPLGPVLAGKMHWAAADAMGSEYGKKYAEADLRRAGLKDDDLKKLAGDVANLTEEDRLVVAFARKLTKAAYTVSDDEMAELLKRFGPDKLVAIVHTIAWANFQNRIVLALGVAVESDGPLPPLDFQLDADLQAKLTTPARPTWKELQALRTPVGPYEPPEWRKQTDAELAEGLNRQKARKARVPLPDPKRLNDLPQYSRAQAQRVVWTNVSAGYQPQLTTTWFDTMRTFHQEAKLDTVFRNSMFWVITRSNECFY